MEAQRWHNETSSDFGGVLETESDRGNKSFGDGNRRTT